jgi:hypothetical protein
MMVQNGNAVTTVPSGERTTRKRCYSATDADPDLPAEVVFDDLPGTPCGIRTNRALLKRLVDQSF